VFCRKNKRYGVFSAAKAHKNKILARTKTHLRFLQIKKLQKILIQRQNLTIATILASNFVLYYTIPCAFAAIFKAFSCFSLSGKFLAKS
jgi:hypothetical protein